MTFLFQSAKPQIPEFEPWYAGWRKKCDRIVCFAGWWRPEIRIEKVGDLEPDSAAISLVAMRANGPTDQRVRSAAERIIAAARKIGKPVCILVANAKEAADWRSLGANSFIVASDQGFMRQAAARTRTDFSELLGAECRHGQAGTTADVSKLGKT